MKETVDHLKPHLHIIPTIMKHLILILLVVCIPFTIHAAQLDTGSTLDFEQVRSLIQSHPEIDSVSSLLEMLPKNFRNEFVLMHDSRSLHRKCVEPDNPRVIFFNSEASFILAAANPNGAEGCTANTVEMIQFKKDAAKFEFRSLTFDGVGKRPVLSDVNPERCLKCHSTDPRPFWGSYFAWPGAYGSLDDTLVLPDMVRAADKHKPLPLETSGYVSFMERKRYEGIYRSLIWDMDRDTINLGRAKPQFRPKNWSGYSYFLRPNDFFLRKLRKLNERRLDRIIAEDPDHPYFYDATYFAQFCEDDGGMEAILNKLPEEMRKEMPPWDPNAVAVEQKAAYDRDIALLEKGMPREWWGYLKEQDPKNPSNTELPRAIRPNDWPGTPIKRYLGPLEYFMQLRGKSTRTWFLPREPYVGTDHEYEDVAFVNVPPPSREGRQCGEKGLDRSVNKLTEWWKKRGHKLMMRSRSAQTKKRKR